ncbi:hypothetical protein [Tateyamaria omphalii]|uniref:hypothetical protein n=1 Tax=Tateyamaria omphalii TaxID=299262 RepID=UPI001E5CEC82|nr:hypothetical protein [Tateyamaria omphalii]
MTILRPIQMQAKAEVALFFSAQSNSISYVVLDLVGLACAVFDAMMNLTLRQVIQAFSARMRSFGSPRSASRLWNKS